MTETPDCSFCGRTPPEAEGMFVSKRTPTVGVCVECADLLKRAIAPNRAYARERAESNRIVAVGASD